MNQPKFEFGEKIFFGKGNSLIIEEIRWVEPYLDYEYNNTVMEKAIIEKPEKKKLYAYRTLSSGNINFRETETHHEAIDCSPGMFLNKKHLERRTPEYDIEYPLTNS
jgi:hypothetical protein